MELQEAIERLTEVRDRYEKNVKILEENNAILKNTNFYEVLGERRADFEAIDTALKELEKLNERIEYALAIAYDYDGYYNPETKRGNAEGLAMTIDDMVDVLKGNMKGVE